MTNVNWNKLYEDSQIAYLRADLASSSPESYTLDEKREIADAVEEIAMKAESAMRAEFATLSPQQQAVMLDLLEETLPLGRPYWNCVLGINVPSFPPKA